MVRVPYAKAIRKRPRRFHKFTPILASHNQCSEYCDECMANFAAQAEYERPGHLWRVEKGELHFKEDDLMENHLGRNLKPNEIVIIKNDDPEDCRIENLEVVEIPDMEGK